MTRAESRQVLERVQRYADGLQRMAATRQRISHRRHLSSNCLRCCSLRARMGPIGS